MNAPSLTEVAYDVVSSVTASGLVVLRHTSTMLPQDRGEYLVRAARHFMSLDDTKDLYTVFPVDVRTFLQSNDFLDRQDVVYPAVMDELCELNSGKYDEAVLTGAIGTGKSTIALLTTAYQLYILSCLKDPHRLFGLDSASEIVFAFQSLNKLLAESIDYRRFRSMIEGSAYFSHHFPFRKNLRSEMVFPKNIVVRPLSGNVNAAIGSNIYGGIIDEVNFMAVVEQSKNAADGGSFDQATEMYNAIVRRRKSRFMTAGGRLPGVLCLVSSKRFPGEFTDRKQAEARDQIVSTGKTSIYVYDRNLWQIKPPGTYGKERFKLFLGDVGRKPRILEPTAEMAIEDAHLVMEVPEEFRSEFARDILSAIRDIAGSATFALHPFIVNTEAVSKSFGLRQPIMSVEETDFVTRPSLYVKRIHQPHEPRLAHVDLGLTGDSAGIAVGWVEGFTKVARSDNSFEMMPVVNFDLILEVRPPKNGEIEFENIRGLFYKLRELGGINLKWITFDTYQSADSLQLLRQKGFTTGTQSMDRTTLPYDFAKAAFYDGRVKAPIHSKALSEMVRLERDPQSGRIDHPPKFSKDCADAVAGVIYGLTVQREIWVRHKVPMREIQQKLMHRRDHSLMT